MTIYTRRVIIVIPASYQPAANQAALQLDATGGLLTFTVPLNPSGSADDAPTHYWASTVATEVEYQQILGMKAQMFPDAIVEEWDMDAAPSKPDELLAGLGLKRVGEKP